MHSLLGATVIYHDPDGGRVAIVVANRGKDGHELFVLPENNDKEYREKNPVATEGSHCYGWSHIPIWL